MKHQITALCVALLASAAGADELEVGPGSAHATIKAAIAAAQPGDTVRVLGGQHREGQLSVDKPLVLEGVDRPVLDGESKHPLLRIAADGVTVRGFQILNGGRSSTQELAGIFVDQAHDFVIENNELRDCDYSIYLSKAGPGIVRGNTLRGLPDLEINSGNGIHLWSCKGVRILRNHVSGHRDGIYLEHAAGSDVEDNIVEGNMRYGLHFMFSNDSLYRANRFTRNGAGVAVMYSRAVTMRDNVFDQNWGSSSYGLLIKDVTDSEVTGNLFDRNSTGLYSQGATRVRYEGNHFRENGWALRIMSNGSSNRITTNNFTRNSFDVGTNGDLADHEFARNYWDRYEGYDLRHDGTGDVPFRPVSLFAILAERVPASLFLMHSFMVRLLDRAEKAFPSVTPDSVIDSTPAMRPHPPSAASLSQPTQHQP